MIQFILNNKEINTALPAGTLLLDFVRYHKDLIGTKIGCREGDCGACTVLVGEITGDELIYRSMTSCLLPLANVHHKHIVTVEGINAEQLNPVQQCIADEGASQCGFCTPGFVVSLAGFCLNNKPPTYKNAIASIDGNICRCTGYKSIERAAARLTELMKERKDEDAIDFVTERKILPQYFKEIRQRLIELKGNTNGVLQTKDDQRFLAGGTDLYVQQPESLVHADINFLYDKTDLKGIKKVGNRCCIGASATVTDVADSEIFLEHFPRIPGFIKLVSSTPVRNMATVAGNFINASPIGDLTIFFLALDAQLLLRDGTNERSIPLRKLYKGYKILDKRPNEFIQQIYFDLPLKNTFFNFEKVSKRTHLDIASVNTALSITINEGQIIGASLSAGGVGPVPLYLIEASEFLKGKVLTEDIILKVIEIAKQEISPISDARGSKEYKALLLGQLITAHFIILFPALSTEKMLIY
ncbi:MAG: FAD binding domain-containing protein [Bacteroidota bacterium]|nr:FAD binding domain-containing protein [Bacteroidota bacterium]